MSEATLDYWVSVTRLGALAGSTLASRSSNDDIVKLMLHWQDQSPKDISSLYN